MSVIKVIQGRVSIRTEVNGTYLFTSKDWRDDPFEVDEAQAERLVGLGVACYADDTELPAFESEESEQEQSSATTEPLSENESVNVEDMSLNELRAYAKKKGYDTKGCKTKNDYIERIKDIESEQGDESDDYENESYDDEEFPRIDVNIPE